MTVEFDAGYVADEPRVLVQDVTVPVDVLMTVVFWATKVLLWIALDDEVVMTIDVEVVELVDEDEDEDEDEVVDVEVALGVSDTSPPVTL